MGKGEPGKEKVKDFLNMLPQTREFAVNFFESQKRVAATTQISLPGRKISICFHEARDEKGNILSGRHPVLFEFHSGGFMMGRAERTDALCERICRDLKIHVVGVNYRLAPEDPFPAAVSDAYDIVAKMAASPDRYRIDPERMAVMGYSCGATLATDVSIQSVLNGDFSLCCQILHYPYLDAVHMPEEKEHYDGDLPDEFWRACALSYAAKEQRSYPLVSPVLASRDELFGLPPALIILAERDALREEGLLFAQHLKKAGVPVEQRVMEKMHHGYLEDAVNPEAYRAGAPNRKKAHDSSFQEKAEEAILLSENFLRKSLSV